MNIIRDGVIRGTLTSHIILQINKEMAAQLEYNINDYSLKKKRVKLPTLQGANAKKERTQSSDPRANLERTRAISTHSGATPGITLGFRAIPEVTPK